MAGGDPTFYLKFWTKLTQPPSKTVIFNLHSGGGLEATCAVRL